MILTRVEFITVPFPSATPIARANVQVKRLKLEALSPRVCGYFPSIVRRPVPGEWMRTK